MATKPNDLGKYTAEQLETMDFRELECLSESWLRVFSVPGHTEEDANASRLATGIFIKRREALRKVAPEMLSMLERLLPYMEDAQEDPGYKKSAVSADLRALKELIKKAEGK